MRSFSLGIVIKAFDQATAPMRRIGDSLSRLTASWRDSRDEQGRFVRGDWSRIGGAFNGVTASVSRVNDETGKLIGRLGMITSGFGLLGGGALYVFKSQFVDVASQFERFGTILETLEGSSAKADKAMSWISDFAASTPYELAQVTDAFVKMRSYGLDPMNGLLRTLGDTSAAMGKPLMQAVEAIADAVTGENERLKEFGIKAAKIGEQIVYEYTDKAGATRRKAVSASNRELIQGVLQSIWNEKYAGSMDKLSGTWEGMLSNLGDQWSRFTRMIMGAGAFDWMKDKLKGLLDLIDGMAASGELQALAERLGRDLVQGLEAAWLAAQELWRGLQGFVGFMQSAASLVGGWGNLLIGLGVIIAGPLLMAVATMTSAFITLGAAIGLTPLGWLMGGITLLIAGAVLFASKWDVISANLELTWQRLKAGFWDMVAGFVEGLARLASALPDFIGGGLTAKLRGLADVARGHESNANLAAGAAAAVLGIAAPKTGADAVLNRGAAAGGGTQRTELVITADNLPRGMNVEVARSDADRLDMSLGYAMAVP